MPFDRYKIREAMRKANLQIPFEPLSDERLDEVTDWVIMEIPAGLTPTVEQIQDLVEEMLIRAGALQTAKAYIIYRAEHTKRRESEQSLMSIFKEVTFASSDAADLKRENANIDADSSMGTMLKYGSEGSKYFVDEYILPKDMAAAHREGRIHIHDKDFYMLTETCCQIDLLKLFEGGFSTGHGYLRKPQSIQSYAALACIAIQANQNEMHGGQSIPHFDYAMAPGVNVSYRKAWVDALSQAYALTCGLSLEEARQSGEKTRDSLSVEVSLDEAEAVSRELAAYLSEQPEDSPIHIADETARRNLVRLVTDAALARVERDTYQAMQAMVHNLNTMNSRAGAQVPFSSVNYGTDTTPAGRLVTRMLLKATEDGLGNGETPIFPVQIFKTKQGINLDPEDPNYDLFKQAIATSAKRLFPNFSFLDAPFNAQYYREGDYDSEVAYMGCRTRVMANVNDRDREVTCGRGNLSFTSLNLPRIGIEARADLDTFYRELDATMDLVVRQLLHRLKIQSEKTVRNYPFLMGQGIWLDSEKLGMDEKVGEVLKHGTLSIGFIGLAETLKALTGKHHGESEASQELGLAIVEHMRERCDRYSRDTGLNFTLLATPAEGLSGRFVKMDRERYGSIPGVTDREYYTNSFHVPVHHPISAFQKIALEAPYHAFTNAGHISYVELDGDSTKNLEAFEAIVRYMHEQGVGYGSVNHPVDRDPVCGYTGVIDEVCPGCTRREEDGVPFQRIRRITGYLVGTTDRFNDGKRAEEHDRVKHGMKR